MSVSRIRDVDRSNSPWHDETRTRTTTTFRDHHPMRLLTPKEHEENDERKDEKRKERKG
jgi:hypothetical protein